MYDPDDKPIKTILLGESGVGKTNLIRISTGKSFDINTNSTLANSYCEDKIKIENKEYIYFLWDTAGQEKYRSMNQLFIKDSKIIFIVFSIDSKKSFDQIDFWYKSVIDQLGKKGYIISLIANKSDLYEEDNIIKDEEIEKKAKELGIKYKITSAKTDPDGFRIFLNEMLTEYINKYYEEFKELNSFKIKPKKKKGNKEKNKCC